MESVGLFKYDKLDFESAIHESNNLNELESLYRLASCIKNKKLSWNIKEKIVDKELVIRKKEIENKIK